MKAIYLALLLMVQTSAWATCTSTETFYVRNDAAADLSGSSNATTAIVSGTGTATAAAASTTVSFTGTPNLSGVTANQDSIFINGSDRTQEVYMITAVDDGADTVTTDAAASAAGIAGVDWAIGGAFDLIEDADTFLGQCGGTGHTIYIKDTGTAYNEAVSFGAAGSLSAPITWEGFQTTPGDDPTGTDRPLNDRGGTNSPAFLVGANGLIIRHLMGRNTGTSAVFSTVNDSNSYVYLMENVKADTSSSNCFSTAGTNKTGFVWDSEATLCVDGSSSTALSFIGLYSHENTDDGLQDVGCTFCELWDNTGTGLEEGRGVSFRENVMAANGSNGSVVNNTNLGTVTYIGNTMVANTGDGFAHNSFGNFPRIYIDNITSDNTSEGWDGDGGNLGSLTRHNNCYNNTCTLVQDETGLAVDPNYVNAGAFNYTPQATEIIGGGYITSPSGHYTTYRDIGAVQVEATGGVAGTNANSAVSVAY